MAASYPAAQGAATTFAHPPRKLLEQVRDVLRVKRDSYRIEQVYVQWIKRFILLHDKRHRRAMSCKLGPNYSAPAAQTTRFFDLTAGPGANALFNGLEIGHN